MAQPLERPSGPVAISAYETAPTFCMCSARAALLRLHLHAERESRAEKRTRHE